ATILEAVKVRERRRDAVRMELKSLGTPARAKVRDTSEIRAELVEYLHNWRDMARQGVAEARRLLRAVLVGRFVFTPVPRPPYLPASKGRGRKPRLIYELKGEASLSGLIAGLISASSVVAPTGFPHRWTLAALSSPASLSHKLFENSPGRKELQASSSS